MKRIFILGFVFGCFVIGATINCHATEDSTVVGWWTFQDAQNPEKDITGGKSKLTICGPVKLKDGEITLKGGTIKLPKDEREYMFLTPRLAEKFQFGQDSFSVECWFKSSTIGYTNLVGSRTMRPKYPKNVGWNLGISKRTGNINFIVNDQKSKLCIAKCKMNEEDWNGQKLNYLVGVRDVAKKEIRLYVNGKLVSTIPDETDDIASKNARLGIGYDTFAGSFTNGTFAEVKITEGVLSTADVEKNFKAGPAK